MGKKQIMAIAVVFVMVFSFTVGFYANVYADGPGDAECCVAVNGSLGVWHICGLDWSCDCQGYLSRATNCMIYTNPNECPLWCAPDA